MQVGGDHYDNHLAPPQCIGRSPNLHNLDMPTTHSVGLKVVIAALRLVGGARTGALLIGYNVRKAVWFVGLFHLIERYELSDVH